MYTIHVDGKLMYCAGAEDEAQIALDVKPMLDIESAGSLSFVLPPGNSQYDSIRKMKSIITMHQDGRQIFRGRALEDKRDSFNQKDVYCEGDRSFLLDSLWEEQTFKGKVQELFRALIDNHNKQVEEDKRFVVGIITAVDAETPYEAEFQVETRRHWDTSTMIDEKMLGVYGGYIRTRTEGDVTYIDWLKDFEEESTQAIRFGVNLLDLEDKVDASDVFTCLIPLGYSEIQDDGTYADPVNIKSVNGGLEYIQDDEAVARYGKIWRTHTWGMTKDPAKLKEKAEAYMKTGAAIRTLTLTALDMHFTEGSIDMIRIGTKVQIDSEPNGIHLNMVCARMDIDPENPEKTKYTFGVKPRALSEAVIRTEKETNNLSGSSGGRGGGGGKSIQEEVSEILRWARIQVDEANASISLNAGEIDKTQQYMKAAGIDINGALASVKILATRESVDDLTGRVDDAEASIEVNADQISMKVSKNGVISAINQTAESITISASRINLEGLVLAGFITTGNLASKIAELDYIIAAALNVTSMEAGNAVIGKLNGYSIAWKESPNFVKSISLSAKDFTTFTDGEGYTRAIPNSWTVSYSRETINYIGR